VPNTGDYHLLLLPGNVTESVAATCCEVNSPVKSDDDLSATSAGNKLNGNFLSIYSVVVLSSSDVLMSVKCRLVLRVMPEEFPLMIYNDTHEKDRFKR